mmetsp:Transcript_2133/g.3547  ORF Transcript_2133/g.3547 Transcript_2133/m.3547 type:complete len:238 (-) Transcript_2133:214-927(-)
MSARICRVHMAEGRAERKSWSRARRASFSRAPMPSAWSSMAAKPAVLKGFTRRAPLSSEAAAPNSEASTSPGLEGARRANRYSSGQVLRPSRTALVTNTWPAPQSASRRCRGSASWPRNSRYSRQASPNCWRMRAATLAARAQVGVVPRYGKGEVALRLRFADANQKRLWTLEGALQRLSPPLYVEEENADADALDVPSQVLFDWSNTKKARGSGNVATAKHVTGEIRRLIKKKEQP